MEEEEREIKRRSEEGMRERKFPTTYFAQLADELVVDCH